MSSACSHLESGGREVKNTADSVRRLLHQMTSSHYLESESIRERLREAVTEMESNKRRMEGEVERAEAEVEEMTQRETEIIQSKRDLEGEVEELKSKKSSLTTEVHVHVYTHTINEKHVVYKCIYKYIHV